MEKGKNIILIGMPGSGKSTLGMELARALDMAFIDGDTAICEREGCALQALLDRRGLDEFLRIEEEVMSALSCRDTVIATGGSVPMRRRAMEHLRKNGVVAYIDVALEELIERIEDPATRGIAFAPGQTLRDLYALRTPVYRSWADITVTVPPNATVDEVTAELLRRLKEY